MPLTKNMNNNEICKYLEFDLKKSIFNDVQPIIQPCSKEGGYFGVPRLILCYIDHLGALYKGYNGKEHNERKIISEPFKAKAFIEDVLGKVHPFYNKYGIFLYEMYRHGTVHLYQPKIFFNDQNEKLSWVTYKGPRETVSEYGKIQHMKPNEFKTKNWIFPISINCLFYDLIESITYFQNMIRTDNNLINNWKSTSNAIIKDEKTDLKWNII